MLGVLYRMNKTKEIIKKQKYDLGRVLREDSYIIVKLIIQNERLVEEGFLAS